MGLFSGITKAIGGVIGDLSDIFTPASALFGDPLVSGGLSLLGGVMSNNANASLAQQKMAFESQQTGTAYQRAVADLKAAGLNPMLAYTNGGASSGSGAQAVMQNAIGSGVSSAMAAKMNAAQVNNLEEQNKAIKAQIIQSLTQSDLNRAATVQASSNAKLADTQAGKVATDTLLSAASIPAARNAASAEDSFMGKYVYPHWDRVMKSINNFPILNWFKPSN